MNIIVVGMGEVGKHIAQLLAYEFHNVVIIDSNILAIEQAEEKMDIMALCGHGASPKTLKEAHVNDADLLIAVTNNDETNLLAGNLGKAFGCKQTIARVSNKEFLPQGRGFYYSYLGVDLIVNPNVLTAIEISKLIKSSHARSSFDFCDNKIQLVENIYREDSKIISKRVVDVKLPESVSIVAIQREGEIIFPDDETIIELGDHIFFIGLANDIHLLNEFVSQNKTDQKKRIVIAGGTDIAVDVASELENFNIDISIIEKDRKRCEYLANKLTRTNIIHGDATQSTLLEEIEIREVDLFVALNSSDEENLISGLLAKDKGSQKTILLAQKKDNMKTFEQLGLDISISPRLLAANQILKFIKRGEIVNVYNILDGEFELLEIVIHKSSKANGRSIESLNIPYGANILLTMKKEDIWYNSDQIILEEGDRLIIWLTPKLKPAIEKIFKKSSR
jgi:trk system potassium uptake protein TrkA